MSVLPGAPSVRIAILHTRCAVARCALALNANVMRINNRAHIMASLSYHCLRMNSGTITSVTVAALMTAGVALPSYPATLNYDPGGWETTITFDEMSLVNNQDVTNEWSSFGVTFEDLKWFEDADADISWGGISTSHLFEPYGDLGTDPFEISIAFESTVSAAGFNFRTGDGPPEILPRDATIRFEAYLGDILKDSFEGVFFGSFEPTPERYFGFTGLFFDRIEIRMLEPDTSPPCCGANIDNLSFTTVVPVPASLPLFAGGLGALWAVGRRARRLFGRS